MSQVSDNSQQKSLQFVLKLICMIDNRYRGDRDIAEMYDVVYKLIKTKKHDIS